MALETVGSSPIFHPKNPVHFVSGIFTFYFLPLHFGGEYYNDNGHLPSKEGRIWYEADINYRFGYRNNQRVVYSNDGLIFVTYDHYKTFFEIV